MKKILLTLALGMALVLLPNWAKAVTIYESATLGATGQSGGTSLSSQFLGSRFTLSQETNITAIGGHMVETGGNGTLWGALISMSALLPAFAPLDIEANALASAIFAPTGTSNEFIQPLAITLLPGDYALVFGDAGLFGTTGSGAMPNSFNTGSVDLPAGIGSYFFSQTDGSQWSNGGFNTVRFVVEGVIVPEPSTMLLLGSGLAGLGWYRRRRKREV